MNKVAAATKKQHGLTLIEVLIAVIIMAMIGTISYQSLDTTISSKEVVEKHIADLKQIDRTWLLIERDLHHFVNHWAKQTYGAGSGGGLPPIVVDPNEGGYRLVVLRGGHANPLNFTRTELIRVGYRIEENVLWRDVWYNLGSTDMEQAQQRKIIDGVDSIEIKALPPTANNVDTRNWLDQWMPTEGAQGGEVPLALEITLRLLDNEIEIKRLFAMVAGK